MSRFIKTLSSTGQLLACVSWLCLTCPLAFAADPVSGANSSSVPDSDVAGTGDSSASIDSVSVVAVVDGEALTSFELQSAVPIDDDAVPAEGKRSPAALRKQALDNLVTSKLIEKEADRLKIRVEESDIDSYTAEVIKNNNLSESEFYEFLGRKGISKDDYRKEVRREILRGRILSREVKERVTVTDEDVAAYLKDHPERLPDAQSIRLEQACFAKADYANFDEAQLKEHVSRLAEQASRSNLSFKEVTGGAYKDLGYVDPDDLNSLLRREVDGLAPGDVSSPVIKDGKVCLIHMVEKAGDKTVDAKLRAEISQSLYKDKYEEMARKYFSEELSARYDVQIFDGSSK